MDAAQDPGRSTECHGLILPETWKSVIERFPFGSPFQQRRAIAR